LAQALRRGNPLNVIHTKKNWYERTRITPSSRTDVNPPCPSPPRNPQNGDLDLQRSRRLTRSVSPSSLPPPHSATEASHQWLRRSCVHFVEAARITGGGTFPASGHESGTRKQVAEVVGQPTSSPPPPRLPCSIPPSSPHDTPTDYETPLPSTVVPVLSAAAPEYPGRSLL